MTCAGKIELATKITGTSKGREESCASFPAFAYLAVKPVRPVYL
jgi:hypothetical protein